MLQLQLLFYSTASSWSRDNRLIWITVAKNICWSCHYCQLIPYHSVYLEGTPLYGFDTGPDPIVLESVDCNGTEPTSTFCPTSPLGQITYPACRESNRAAGIACRFPPGSCTDGQTRLADGPGFYEGRLEVCRENQWQSVCEQGFDMAAALSVCSSRLFLYGSMCRTFVWSTQHDIILCCISTDATAVYGNAYGSGTGPTLIFCRRSFSSIPDFFPIGDSRCPSSPLTCSHEHSVGVQCTKGRCKYQSRSFSCIHG